MFSKETEEVLKIGKPLFELGINNWALTKSEVILAIERLYSLGIPILGGDVYEVINEELQSNYDNWYCEQMPQETREDFLHRSIKKARNYIDAYRSNDLNTIYFVLVPDA